MSGNGDANLDLNGMFNMGDIIMMIDLLQYGAVRASMEGGKAAGQRLATLQKQLQALSPLPKSKRGSSMGVDWYNACKAAQSCSYFAAYLVECGRGYGNSDFHLDVVCDGQVFRVVQHCEKADIEASLPAVRGALRDIAPVGAEPLVLLKGLVDLEGVGRIRRRELAEWENEGRLDDAKSWMEAKLSPATPFVHLIDAENYSGAVVDARFAVPVSRKDDVVAHVADINSGAVEDYKNKWSGGGERFATSPCP